MKRLLTIPILLATFAGCEAFDLGTKNEETVAYKRWHHTRAKMLCGVGKEYLEVGQLDHARNKAREALSLDKDYVEAQILLSKVQIEQGQYAAAEAGLQKVVLAEPRSARAVYLLAVALEKKGDLEEALDNYRRAYALDNTNISAIVASAEVMVAMGDVAEAQAYLEGYLATGSGDPAMFEAAGRIAMMQRHHEKAAKHFQNAHDSDYKNVRYREALGRSLFLAGKYALAMETLKELTELKEYSARAWVYTMLGDCYMALGRTFHARDSYLAASERKPDDAGVWVNLAKAAVAMKDDARAILSAKHALDLQSGRLDATMLLGYALLRTGRADDAIAVLRRGSSAHPSSGLLQCILGRAYWAAGKEAQAVRCYMHAARLEPENLLARKLLAGAGRNEAS